MAAGTNVRAVRRALVDLLTTRLGATVSVRYAAPTDAVELATTAGILDTIWTAYDDADLDVVTLGTPLRLDETARVLVVAQVVRTDGTDQDTVDERAEELLRDVLAVVANNPEGLALTDTDELSRFDVVPLGWSVGELDNGVIGGDPSVRGARFVIRLEATGRLELT